MKNSRLNILRLFLCFLVGSAWTGPLVGASDKARPSFVIIFTDDQGYQDVGVFGSPDIETPNLDRMANEGIRFTNFYVGQPVCSASRAALLTGCYPNRIGIEGALNPSSTTGINKKERTIAEVLKTRGYATAIYGKWHLGYQRQFLPLHHGFDDYFGLPYSNDMWPKHPTQKFPDLPLIEGDEIIQYNPDQSNLTTWYTEHALRFIEKNKHHPFFLYLAHNMPHVPLFVSDKYKGKSKRGLYGDVIMEIDWSVGQILKALKQFNLDEQTLVIFTSDNGPWLLYGDHAGTALPLREGKMTSFEGGFREPCIMRWPSKIPAGIVCRQIAMTIDFLPTLANLAGAKLPSDRILDGKNIWPLMSGQPGAKTPHDAIFYYWGHELQAVRSGKWKLHVAHSYKRPEPPGKGGKPGIEVTRQIGLELFDLENDIAETANVADRHPDVVKRLAQYLEKAREDLGDSLTGRQGKNVRPPGRVDSQ
jgi:arylsulfatase A-like enzyme